MSYVDAALLPGEAIVFRTRLHRVVLLRPVVLATLGLGAAAALVFVLKGPWYLVAAAFVACGAWAGAACVTRASSEFAVTSQRIIAKTGFLRVASLEMQLSKVEAVSTNQGLLGRLFGYGTVVVIGTGGTQQTLGLLASPMEFARHIQASIAPEKGRPPLRY